MKIPSPGDRGDVAHGLGINVNVVTLGWNEYLDQLGVCRATPSDGSCTYDAYYLGWAADYFDEWNILNDLFHPDSTSQPHAMG